MDTTHRPTETVVKTKEKRNVQIFAVRLAWTRTLISFFSGQDSDTGRSVSNLFLSSLSLSQFTRELLRIRMWEKEKREASFSCQSNVFFFFFFFYDMINSKNFIDKISECSKKRTT